MFKKVDPEIKAEKAASRELEKSKRQAAADQRAFEASPPGQARMAIKRGDRIFQYVGAVEVQEPVIVAMIGSTTTRKSTDQNEILNAIAAEGWEIVSGSFVFREQGSQSRDKFMSSGQNIAVKGATIGYYLFRANRAI
jgi:hypothetical protein